jgi:hypothetical protein
MNWQSGVRRAATPARFLTAQRQNHVFFAPTKGLGKIKDHAKTVQKNSIRALFDVLQRQKAAKKSLLGHLEMHPKKNPVFLLIPILLKQ